MLSALQPLKQKINGLNGWRRIWLVIFVVYVIFLLTAGPGIPTKSTIMAEYAKEAFNAIKSTKVIESSMDDEGSIRSAEYFSLASEAYVKKLLDECKNELVRTRGLIKHHQDERKLFLTSPVVIEWKKERDKAKEEWGKAANLEEVALYTLNQRNTIENRLRWHDAQEQTERMKNHYEEIKSADRIREKLTSLTKAQKNASNYEKTLLELDQQLQAIGHRYQEKLENIYLEQMLFVGFLLALYIIPVLAFYGLGLLFKWIYSGFKKGAT